MTKLRSGKILHEDEEIALPENNQPAGIQHGTQWGAATQVAASSPRSEELVINADPESQNVVPIHPFESATPGMYSALSPSLTDPIPAPDSSVDAEDHYRARPLTTVSPRKTSHRMRIKGSARTATRRSAVRSRRSPKRQQTESDQTETDSEGEDDLQALLHGLVQLLQKRQKPKQPKAKQSTARVPAPKLEEPKEEVRRTERAKTDDEPERRPTTAKFAKLPLLPALTSIMQLQRHYRYCEMLLLEEGIDLDRLKAKLALVETLSPFQDLKNSAFSLTEGTWAQMKATLVRCYCDPNNLRMDIERRLVELQFVPSRMFEFVTAARALHCQISDDCIDVSGCVSRIFGKIPEQLLTHVITEARRRNPAGDWRLAPFENLLAYLSEAISLSQAIDEVNLRRRADQYPPATTYRQPSSVRVSQISEGKVPWLEKWVDGFKGVLFCNGLEGEAELKALSSDLYEVKFINGRKGPYALVGFRSDTPPQLSCSSRPFVLRTNYPSSKNV